MRHKRRPIIWFASLAMALLPSLSGCRRPAGPASRPSYPRMATAPSAPQQTAIDLGDGVTLKLVLIRPGTFMMGRDKQPGLADLRHQVTISRPFYMGVYEVTQQQYEKVMGTNPSFLKEVPDQRPVDQVSWDDAVAFCEKVSDRLGRTLRLPTEAEWEYACRAGSTTAFCFGDDAKRLGEYGWYSGNRGEYQSQPVGQKNPNAFGLFDMHGNVEEWCADWYDNYPAAAQIDPTGPPREQCRVIRGGDFGCSAERCRSDSRDYNIPRTREMDLGFRVVIE